MLNNKLLTVIYLIFVNRLTKVENVLAVLLVEVRQVALVPLALSGGFFLILFLRFKQVEESGSVYLSLGVLVEQNGSSFRWQPFCKKSSVDIVNLRYPLLQ